MVALPATGLSTGVSARACCSSWLAQCPGNLQLCGGLPANADFELCKRLDNQCVAIQSLGTTCVTPAASDNIPQPGFNVEPSAMALQVALHSSNVTVEQWELPVCVC